jgi:hypothetical protein
VRARTVADISEGASQNSGPTAMVKNSTPKSSNGNTTSASSSHPLWNQGSSALRPSYEVDYEVNNVVLESDLLWDGVSRRDSSQVSSERHEPIVRACEIYLKALILSGQAGCELTAWPEIYRVWFSRTMGRAWVSMTKTMGTTPGRRDIGVDSRPTAFEARKVQCQEAPSPLGAYQLWPLIYPFILVLRLIWNLEVQIHGQSSLVSPE